MKTTTQHRQRMLRKGLAMSKRSAHIPTADGGDMAYHELYNVWMNMMQRCYNPNVARYPRYGGRGIRVHLPWHAAKVFIEEVGPRPHKDMQIDRIDNDGHYEPGNVRWVARKQNIRNRDVTCLIEYEGEMRPLIEVSELTGLNKSTLRGRMLRGESNLFRPVEPKMRRAKAIAASQPQKGKV